MKKIFDGYDSDKNGEITRDELKDAFKRMDFPMSDLQIANLMGKVDTDGSGTIDFDEFCAYKEAAASRDVFEVSFSNHSMIEKKKIIIIKNIF